MNVLVYGSKVFGQVVRFLLKDCGYSFTGFIDDYAQGPDILGSYQKIRKSFPSEKYMIVNAIGYRDLSTRKMVTNKIIDDGYKMPNLIHPMSYVATNAEITFGIMAMANTSIDYSAIIYNNVVLWPNSTINHDCVIGENSFLSPSSTICGCTTVGNNCFIGAGAIVVDHVEVPDNTIVKAGSLYKKEK